MYNAPNHERSDATSVNMCDVHVFMRMHTCAHIWRSEMDAGVFPSYLLSQVFSEPGTLARLASQSSPRSPSFSVLSTARPIAFGGHVCLSFIVNIMRVGMACPTRGGFPWADRVLCSPGALEPSFLRVGTAGAYGHRDAVHRSWKVEAVLSTEG